MFRFTEIDRNFYDFMMAVKINCHLNLSSMFRNAAVSLDTTFATELQFNPL